MSTPVDPIPKVTKKDLLQHTEQSLVQMIYVKTANDMIGSAMANLDNALRTTQSVLNILQALQNLRNEIEVKSKGDFPFLFSTGGIPHVPVTHTYVEDVRLSGDLEINYSTVTITGFPQAGPHGGVSLSPSSYRDAYLKAASAYFGQAIDPNFIFESAGAVGYSNFINTLKALKSALRIEISSLIRQTPSADRNDPGTLLANIRKVYASFPSNFDFMTVEKWAIDNYSQKSGVAGLAGKMQNELTFAITAAENLNDTQKEKVRRFLFIFQEYYQSAAAILSAIHQVVNQIAQKISQ